MGLLAEESDRLEGPRDEWDDLVERSSSRGRIFSSWDWQRLWWRFFGRCNSLRILTLRGEGEVAGIWPVYDCEGALALLGGADVCDYLDIIAEVGREREVLGEGLLHFTEQGVSDIDLRFVPAHSPTHLHLPELASKYGWTLEREIDDVCPAVMLPESWEGYLAGLSKKNRHELRRKQRRLSEAGESEWQVVFGAKMEQEIDDFLRLHRHSRPEKAAFMDSAMEDFFRSVIAHFAPTGRVKIYFLGLSGRRVAATLCFEHGDELWVYNSGFDRDYASYSVGLLLKAFCIKDAIEQGKRKVDFLRGREPYKYDLGAEDVPAYRLRLKRA